MIEDVGTGVVVAWALIMVGLMIAWFVIDVSDGE
ncbi:membrane protein [Gordonia phage Nedarya]|nr:membrane protein [Gordonia phage Nedarya]